MFLRQKLLVPPSPRPPESPYSGLGFSHLAGHGGLGAPQWSKASCIPSFIHNILVVTMWPVLPRNHKARLSRDPGTTIELCGRPGEKGGTWLLFLTSSGSPYSSRVARRGRVKYFWEPRITEDSGVRAALNRIGPQSPPKPRSPVPPLPASLGGAVRAVAGAQVSPAASQRSSQATTGTATARAARTPKNARRRGARPNERRTEAPAYASRRS